MTKEKEFADEIISTIDVSSNLITYFFKCFNPTYHLNKQCMENPELVGRIKRLLVKLNFST